MHDVIEVRRSVGDRAPTGGDLGVRNDFPIFDRPVNGKPLVWLDNAATTQKPRAVIERLVQFYERENANVHRGGHALGSRATEAFEWARETVRSFVNAADSRSLVFVRGTTEAINLVANAWGRSHIRKGDEILVSALEHHSNLVPWQMLAVERGATLRFLPIHPNGELNLDEFERLLGSRVRLVALAHVSNALGTVTPVGEITRRAHEKGAVVVVDGAQAVPHVRVDEQSLDVDFYAFSGHKVFGPTGVGVLYGKPERLEEMSPWQGGGSMVLEVTAERAVFKAPPDRFEAGTPNVADAIALGTALQYLVSAGLDRVEAHDRALTKYALRALDSLPGMRQVGTAENKVGVTSFVIDGVSSAEIGNALDREGIAVRVGHHCALPALQSLGVDVVVRPSLALYNTTADVDALVTSLERFLDRTKRARRTS